MPSYQIVNVQHIIFDHSYHVVQQISRAYSSCLTETFCILIDSSPYPIPLAPSNHHSMLGVYECGYFGYLI
jgi:hypothetical protein